MGLGCMGFEHTAAHYTHGTPLLLMISSLVSLSLGEVIVSPSRVDRTAISDVLALEPSQCGSCATYNARQAPRESCKCCCDPSKNSSYFEAVGKCAEGRVIRQNLGCTAYFSGESLSSPLYLSSHFLAGKILKNPPGKECRVNRHRSINGFLDCDGTWKSISAEILYEKFGAYKRWTSGPCEFVKRDSNISSRHLDGRIIRLDVECRPKNGSETPLGKNCLLFKMTGQATCGQQSLLAFSAQPTRMQSFSAPVLSTNDHITYNTPILLVVAAVAVVLLLTLLVTCAGAFVMIRRLRKRVKTSAPSSQSGMTAQGQEEIQRPASRPDSKYQSLVSPGKAAVTVPDAPSLAVYEQLNPGTRASLTYDYAEHPEFPVHLFRSTGPAFNAGYIDEASSAYLEPADEEKTTSPGSCAGSDVALKRNVHYNILSIEPKADRDAQFPAGNASSIINAQCTIAEPAYIDILSQRM